MALVNSYLSTLNPYLHFNYNYFLYVLIQTWLVLVTHLAAQNPMIVQPQTQLPLLSFLAGRYSPNQASNLLLLSSDHRRSIKSERFDPLCPGTGLSIPGAHVSWSRVKEGLRGHAFVVLGFQRMTVNQNYETKYHIHRAN